MIWIIAAGLSLAVAGVVAVVIRRRRNDGARHRAGSTKRILASVAGLCAGIVIAVSSAGATYAYLNAQTSVGGATLTSGTLGVAVSPTSIAPTTWTGLLPGETARQTVTVTSSGNAPATIGVKLAAATTLVVRVAAGACTTTVLASTPLTTASASLGDFTAGQARTFCVQVGVPATGAAENTSYGFSLVFDSIQKAA